MTAPATTTIRTPDHRVRVFVSSTLQELAAERQIVREAIQRVRLTPVMFEMGARAHPPRDLYRAYLAQSDVFIGLYWKRYGWVAPDMNISGLEDEYLLADKHPKLIYVKATDEREPGLRDLLGRIQNDRVSYRPFSRPEELADLICDDLVAMLSETFTSSGTGSKPKIDVEPVDERPADAPPPHAPPPERAAMIGRDEELAVIERVVLEPTPRVVTLTGPGGTGKTRLAIRLSHRMREQFPDGVYYVSLASVRDATRVFPAIMQTLEVPMPQGGGDPDRVLTGALRRQKALLVLDNFEQVIDAAQAVGDLAAACPDLRIVVTSRHALRMNGETEVPIPTMSLASAGDALSPAEALFERRAKEVVPSFSVNATNRAAVREICRRLDGLPLALELAAARVRVLAPQTMVSKLDGALSLLSSTAKDLPERQRTLRATLTWSFDLLPEPERVLFRRLGVLNGRFTTEAAAAVAGDVEGVDVLDGLANLLDKSLLVRTEALGEPRFHMLETVRDFARERCAEAGEENDSRGRHAAWVERFASEHMPHVVGGNKLRAEMFALEDAAMRTAMQWCFGAGGDRELGWRLYFSYACVAQMQMRLADVLALHATHAADGLPADEATRPRVTAVEAWAASAAGDYSAFERLAATLPQLYVHGPRAVAAWCTAVVGMGLFFSGQAEQARGPLEQAHAVFDQLGDTFGATFASSMLALGDMMSGNIDAGSARLTAEKKRCEAKGDDEGASMAASGLARAALMSGDVPRARLLYADACAFARDRRTVWGRTDALFGLSAVVCSFDEPEEAEAVLEETLLCVERAGSGGHGRMTLGILLGPLANLAAKRGDLARAARLFVGVPDGFEDSEDPQVTFIDPLGALRRGVREARAAVGLEAQVLSKSGFTLDDALQTALAKARRTSG